MSQECGAAWAGTAWPLLSDTSSFVKTVPGLASGPQSTASRARAADTPFPREPGHLPLCQADLSPQKSQVLGSGGQETRTFPTWA